MSRSSLAILRPPPHARAASPAARPPAAVAPPLVALGPDSVGRLQPFVSPAGACEPWLSADIEPAFECPADQPVAVAELLAVGAIPPAALDLYAPQSARRLRTLAAVIERELAR